jgi:hypothetical protein
MINNLANATNSQNVIANSEYPGGINMKGNHAQTQAARLDPRLPRKQIGRPMTTTTKTGLRKTNSPSPGVSQYPRTQKEFEAAITDACRTPRFANEWEHVPSSQAGPIFRSLTKKVISSTGKADRELARDLTNDLAVKALKRGPGTSPSQYDPDAGFPILQWLFTINDVYAD